MLPAASSRVPKGFWSMQADMCRISPTALGTALRGYDDPHAPLFLIIADHPTLPQSSGDTKRVYNQMESSGNLKRAFKDSSRPLFVTGLPFNDAVEKYSRELFNSSRIYLSISKSLHTNTDSLKRLQGSLKETLIGVRVGMRPHTYISEVLEIVAEMRNANVDMILTVGGGSLTDGAKLMALALENNVNTKEELMNFSLSSQRPTDNHPTAIPVVCVPSILAGGEYSRMAGGTDDETHHKHVFRDLIAPPSLVILDPDFATHTPDSVWLSTGIRAVDHCVEGLASLNSNNEVDTIAARGLPKIIEGLLRTKSDATDVVARQISQLGVIDSMFPAYKGVSMGGSHGIGHQLGPFGVGHGETSCIILPAVQKYNARSPEAKKRQQLIIEVLWENRVIRERLQSRGLEQGKSDLGDILDGIICELGLPRSLKQFGIGPEKLSEIAKSSLKDKTLKANPVPLLEEEQVRQILEMCL